jgi:hypothetical protein
MVSISKPPAGAIPSVWVENSVCNTGSNGKCKISSPKKSRIYVIRVTATDKAGNTGIGECSITVGNQIINASDPLFTIAQIQVVGGVDDENLVSPVPKTSGMPLPKAGKRQGV